MPARRFESNIICSAGRKQVDRSLELYEVFSAAQRRPAASSTESKLKISGKSASAQVSRILACISAKFLTPPTPRKFLKELSLQKLSFSVPDAHLRNFWCAGMLCRLLHSHFLNRLLLGRSTAARAAGPSPAVGPFVNDVQAMLG